MNDISLNFNQAIVVLCFNIVTFIECAYFAYLFFSKRMLNNANHGIFKNIVYMYMLTTTCLLITLIYHCSISKPLGGLGYYTGFLFYYFYLLGISWGIIWVADIYLTCTRTNYKGESLYMFTLLAYGCPLLLIVYLCVIHLTTDLEFITMVI
jgi:hypothetical protein